MSFSHHTEQLKALIWQQGIDPSLCWVFRDDLVVMLGSLWVSAETIAEDSTSLAEALYERGMEIGQGVELFAFATCMDRILCSVNVPRDSMEAEYRMMPEGSAKMVVRQKLRRARLVSPAIFRLLKRIVRQHPADKETLEGVALQTRQEASWPALNSRE